MLERCEIHLRALHVESLGPLVDRSPESTSARREQLGLADGYPAKQLRGVLIFFIVLAALFAIATGGWF